MGQKKGKGRYGNQGINEGGAGMGGVKRQEIRKNKTGNAENTMASQDLAGFFVFLNR